MTDCDMWNDKQQHLIIAVLNEIIPASADGNMPAAGELGVADFIDKELGNNETYLTVIKSGLAKLEKMSSANQSDFCSLSSSQKVTVLKQLEAEDEAFFQLLTRYTYMGYYSRPDIRALLHLSPKPVHPDGYQVTAETPEQMSTLTRPVVERGHCYREV